MLLTRTHLDLDLAQNQIESLNPAPEGGDARKNLSTLKKLFLSSNKLRVLELPMIVLPFLESLTLFGNYLENFQGTVDALGSCFPNLTKLNLDGNNLGQFDKLQVKERLPRLQSLDDF
jgi:Leucine-rich repeat (LRR) protein